MANTQSLTEVYKVNSSDTFRQTVNTVPHYVFASKITSYIPNDDTIPAVNTSVTESVIKTFDDMIFGKVVSSTDISPMVANYVWAAGNVYSQYDPDDAGLAEKQFYTVVNLGDTYYVYKCLGNNNGVPSLVPPTGLDTSPFISPVDGYIWKYMYSFPSSLYTKFSISDTHIPVLTDASVLAAATPGTIDVIQVTNIGSGYSNYFAETFRSQDIRIGLSDTTYGLVETASDYVDFYTGCVIRMTSGAAVNEFKTITGYFINSGVKYIIIDSAFDNTPLAGDTYEIWPAVKVTGDGNETVNCYALAIVNSAGNTISSIEVLNSGKDYRTASAEIISSNSVGILVQAAANPLVAPAYGHGGNVYKELFAKYSCISVKFSSNENGFISASNDYRVVGLIKDPKFNSVSVPIVINSLRRQYTVGETLSLIKDIKLFGTANVSTSNAVITGTNTTFQTVFSVGDNIWITDGTNDLFTSVSAITSNTNLTLANTPTWSNTNCNIYLFTEIANGLISSLTTNTVILDSVSASINSNYTRIYGQTTFATTTIDATQNITINGNQINEFNTYNQLTTFNGTFISGTQFAEDEVLTGSNLGSAIFHSQDASNVYVVDCVNFDNFGNTISSSDGQTQFQITNKYKGNLELDSGEVVYLENLSPIIRQNNSTEVIKILFSF